MLPIQINKPHSLDLNVMSDRALQAFADVSVRTSDYLDAGLMSVTANLNTAHGAKEAVQGIFSQSPNTTSFISQAAGVAGKALDTAFGVLDVGRALRKDLGGNNTSYDETMKAILGTTAKIGAGTVVTAGAAMLGGAIGAPLAVGIGLGFIGSVATGYLIDQL